MHGMIALTTYYYLLILIGPCMRTLEAGQKIAPSIPVFHRCDCSPPRMPSQLVSFFLHSSSPTILTILSFQENPDYYCYKTPVFTDFLHYSFFMCQNIKIYLIIVSNSKGFENTWFCIGTSNICIMMIFPNQVFPLTKLHFKH